MARLKKVSKSTGKRILLVDDQEEYRITAANLIRREGHEVVTAESGECAIELLKKSHFDLLLLDYFMYGGMNGEETIIKLRKFNPYVQIILQTGYAGDKPPREMLKRLDIQGYYDKSEGPEKLLLWVDIGLKFSHTVQHLNRSRMSLKYILDITPELHKLQQLEELLQGILLQVSGLLGIMNSFIAIFPSSEKIDYKNSHTDGFLALLKEKELNVRASTGRFGKDTKIAKSEKLLNSDKIYNAMKNKDVKIYDGMTIIPLSIGDEILGIIYLEESVFLEQNLELLNIFANQAAIAIQNTYLYEMATLDPLTGVYTRRFFDNCMLRELRTALRLNKAFTLIMLDMDKLKWLNDNKGHLAGDQALKVIGKVLSRSTRSSDYPCRYGGDEFAVLLTNTTIEQSKIVVERILYKLENIDLSEYQLEDRVQVSIGATGIKGPDFRKEDTERPHPNIYFENFSHVIVKKADEMLYDAKKKDNAYTSYSEALEWPPFKGF